MLPLPKLFDATRAPDISDGFKFQIIPGGDPLVDQIISGAGLSGMVGTTAYIQVVSPTLVTVFWSEQVAIQTVVHSQTIGYAAGSVTEVLGSSTTYATVTKSATVAVTESSSVALAAAASTAAIILAVIALAIIADKLAKAKAERNFKLQRDAIDTLNTQIEELSVQESILREKLQSHLDTQEKLLNQNITNLKNYATAYQVKKGDNLSKIAAANGISLNELLNANTIFSKDLLYNQGPESGILNNLGRNPNLIFPGEYVNIPIVNENQNIANYTSVKTLELPPQLNIVYSNNAPINIPEIQVYTREALYNRIIEIISKNPNWYDIVNTQEENRLIELIRYANQDDPRGFLSLLNDGTTLQFLQSTIQNTWYEDAGNYNELHQALYEVWLQSASSNTDLANHINEVLKFNDNGNLEPKLQEYLAVNLIPWSNPGIVKTFTQTPWKFSYSVSLNDNGKIDVKVDKKHNLLGFIFESENKTFDPWEPVTIEFQTTSKKYPEQVRGSQLTLPAFNLLLLENEQTWDNINQSANAALVALALTNPITGAALIEASIGSIAALVSEIKRDFKVELESNKSLSQLNNTLNAIELVVSVYGVTQLAKNGAQLLKNLQNALNKLENNPNIRLNPRFTHKTDDLKFALRNEYHLKVSSLELKRIDLLKRGNSKYSVAIQIFEERRKITIDYKNLSPEDLQKWIFKRNMLKYEKYGYGDKWGLTWEGAIKKTTERFEQKIKNGQINSFSLDDVYDEIAITASITSGETKEELGKKLMIDFCNFFEKGLIPYEDIIELDKVLLKYKML